LIRLLPGEGVLLLPSRVILVFPLAAADTKLGGESITAAITGLAPPGTPTLNTTELFDCCPAVSIVTNVAKYCPGLS
jgi:hypothetical protein